MAPAAGTLRVGRYFAALIALFALLYLVVFLPGHRHTPKLGLDLVGGREVIFKASTPGGKTPTSSQMEQSKQIMEERVNASGTTGATVVIEGDDRIDISIPGGTSTDVAALGKAAQLNFRPLIAPAIPISCGATAPASGSTSASGSAGPSASTGSSSPAPTSGSGTTGSGTTTPSSSSVSPNSVREKPLAAATTPAKTPTTTSATTPASSTSPATSATASPSGTPATSPSGTASTDRKCLADPLKSVLATASLGIKAIPTSEAGFQALTQQQQTAIGAALSFYDCNSTQSELDITDSYYVACDTTSTVAYLLGTVIVKGSQIDSASAQAPSTTGQGLQEWSVQLNLKSAGDDAWSAWTAAHNTSGQSSATTGGPESCSSASTTSTPCSDYVGFTLDGQVISAPVTQSAINHLPTSISGSFQQDSANTLADQLNFGALPTSFSLELNQNISATLGAAQLKAGLLAGGIGLVLVIIYSLIYYRALGLVTIASLLVSGGLTWAMLVILGNQIGYSLDLAGIAGFIVAIGITADSFVVFFERIKDEVHEGRSVRVAVPRAWVRARRTVLSADTVSFLAAAILYYFAAGEVRGFAFTLGLSTVLDLVVVFLFTHPLVSLLSRSRAFGSARFTGLNAVREGGIATGGDGDAAPPRRQRPSRPATTRPARAATATVVLDKATDADLESDDELDEPAEDLELESDAATDTATAADASTDDEVDDEVEVEQTRPRKRSAPAGGTAAERAAARRARLKAEQDDQDGKDQS